VSMGDDDRNLLKVVVSRPAMSLPFTEGAAFHVDQGLPQDSHVVGWDYKTDRDAFVFVFETEVGRSVAELGEVPKQDVVICEIDPDDLKDLDYVNERYHG